MNDDYDPDDWGRMVYDRKGILFVLTEKQQQIIRHLHGGGQLCAYTGEGGHISFPMLWDAGETRGVSVHGGAVRALRERELISVSRRAGVLAYFHLTRRGAELADELE